MRPHRGSPHNGASSRRGETPGRPLDVTTLVAGIGVTAFGVMLLLAGSGLRFSALGPAAFALVGAILLASGLTRRS